MESHHWYQRLYDGFWSPKPLVAMVFQWFPMVANHWSNDGMVTIHRSGLGRVLDGVQAIHIFSNIFEYFWGWVVRGGPAIACRGGVREWCRQFNTWIKTSGIRPSVTMNMGRAVNMKSKTRMNWTLTTGWRWWWLKTSDNSDPDNEEECCHSWRWAASLPSLDFLTNLGPAVFRALWPESTLLHVCHTFFTFACAWYLNKVFYN